MLFCAAALAVQLNLSVAFMNMLPVFSLDGGLACPQFARILFPRYDGGMIASHGQRVADVCTTSV